jgi:hypothetical protein
MASSYSTDLKLEIMVTGENAGTWGDITNTNLVLLQQAIGGYQEVSIAGGAQTTALVMSNGALSNARNAVIKLIGTITGNQIVTVPDGIEKTYIIANGTVGAFTVEFKTASGTGITFGATDKSTKEFFADGTNIVDTGTVSETGVQTLTNKTLTSPALTNATGSLSSPTITTPVIAQINDTNGNEELIFTATASAVNEITLANAATGNNPVISATGGDTNVGLTLTPKGDLGRITLNGESKIFGVFENAFITTTFITALNYDVLTQAVYFQNVNLGSNFTVNFRGDGSNTLNSALATGESVTAALITKQANTTFFNTSVITVDGTSTGVTVVYQGGSAPTTGNASSNDVYTYTAIKTAASTYTILAAQTQFK